MPDLLFQLGNIRSLQGRYREAEACYRESHARDARTIVVRSQILRGCSPDGITKRIRSPRDRRPGHCSRRTDTRTCWTHHGGVAYLASGRSDLAIKELEDAVTAAPSPIKYLHLAQAYLSANRRLDADGALANAKSAGLKVENLTPLERTACRGLIQELAQR